MTSILKPYMITTCDPPATHVHDSIPKPCNVEVKMQCPIHPFPRPLSFTINTFVTDIMEPYKSMTRIYMIMTNTSNYILKPYKSMTNIFEPTG